MSFKVKKSKTILTINYQSFFAPLGAVVLLLIMWGGFVLLNFSGSALMWALFLTPALLWIANLSFEGFHLKFDVNQKSITLYRWHGFMFRSDFLVECPFTQIEEFQIERGHRSTKRLVIKINNESVFLTNSFDNTGRQERLAKEIIDWLKTLGYSFRLSID